MSFKSSSSLEAWFTKEGISDLFTNEISEREEDLIWLATEKQWSDIDNLSKSFQIPSLKRPFFKSFLNKKAKEKAQNKLQSHEQSTDKSTISHIAIDNQKKIESVINNAVENKKHSKSKKRKRNKKERISANSSKSDSSDANLPSKMFPNPATQSKSDIPSNINNICQTLVAHPEWKSNYSNNGFKYNEIPIIESDIVQYFDQNQELKENILPMIINSCHLLGDKCMSDWKNLQYINNKLKTQSLSTTVSNTREFRFWDESKANTAFVPPTKNVLMTFDEFVKSVLQSRSYLDECQLSNGSLLTKQKTSASDIEYYLLSLNVDQLNNAFTEDIATWDWSTYFQICSNANWGPLTHYNLQISMKGCFLPLQCLQNESIFVQIRGNQEIILFDDNSSLCLYPFIDSHACCNQSMVNVEFPGKQEMPAFGEFHSSNARLNGYRTILSPGSLLYVPNGWWMETTHLNDFSMCVQIGSQPKSVKSSNMEEISIKQKLNIQHNIERLSLKEYGIETQTAIFMSFLNEKRNVNTDENEYRNERSKIMDILRNVFCTDSEIEQFMHEMIEGRYNVCSDGCVSRKTLFL